MAPPDPYDADLSALRGHVADLGAWLAIWEHRAEPDAHARRCASDAIAALDGLSAAAYRIRAELVTEICQADEEAAARVDALLAKTRDGPRPSPVGSHPSRSPTASPKAPQASASVIIRRGEGSGRAPHQEPP